MGDQPSNSLSAGPLAAQAIMRHFENDRQCNAIAEIIRDEKLARIRIEGLRGSATALLLAMVRKHSKSQVHLVLLNDKESAVYFANDLENLIESGSDNFHDKKVLFFPASYKKPYDPTTADNSNVLLRTEALKRLSTHPDNNVIVSYPEALSELVVNKQYLEKSTLRLRTGENVDLDFVYDLLEEYGFERVEFVAEPGQMAMRGGIVDVFSFTNDLPYRIEFAGDGIASLRTFDPATQLSVDTLDHLSIVPNLQERVVNESRQSLMEFLPQGSVLWLYDTRFAADRIGQAFQRASEIFEGENTLIPMMPPEEIYLGHDVFLKQILDFSLVEFGIHPVIEPNSTFGFSMQPQPSFNKNFDLLLAELGRNTESGTINLMLADSEKQAERIRTILSDLVANHQPAQVPAYEVITLSLHEGFASTQPAVACYTDHQLFDRYHKFRLRESFSAGQAFTLNELYNLKPGDYVTHIDHGVGRYDGLEKINNNGKWQEAIRIIYAHDDLLYVSIHSLHRISRYAGKEGHIPSVDKLGGNAWSRLKSRTKGKVKDIARDLIRLYAQRKASRGFAFTPDTYLQHELEASFIYEDTPDQLKSTLDVKRDMEAPHPMDRLVCGDVGFGKTEVAIRAAFKAVADSKQVAMLVPTTILAVQHFKTFSERLKELPCKVDYLNRFKSTARQHETLRALEAGKVDILIGTHRLLSADVKFKDLGLLIIDEEQKFGVAAKEKLKNLKSNVDTLVLTATPIPRTLQFSMMGARDLSVINTPPPNRYPVLTEVSVFNEDLLREAIHYELSRGGQVFFVNNRIQNLEDLAAIIRRLVPKARVAVAHGQMDGQKLEDIMLGFVEGDSDVLVSTTIVEAGLDIPNANTIIINDAHHYGLSDLHQLRGRVGRSNRKAFCYLLAPPPSLLSDEARKRLKAIEEFAEIGSGFNIAMRDLDIRGAGNILGAEQSGFITEIGFDMYQKILDEAIAELKVEEFAELYAHEEKEFVKECLIETDLEAMIPDAYVVQVNERLNLYRQLDNCTGPDKLTTFSEMLLDRFGPMPKQVQVLLNVVRMRQLAKECGIEKLTYRNSVLTCYLVANEESAYYQSVIFSNILAYAQSHLATARIKEIANKPALTIHGVKDERAALEILRGFCGQD